jgi:hypothetical protein
VPIPPSGSFEIVAKDPAACPGGIDAALFADGHTEGAPAQVEAIFERRRGIHDAIDSALPLLKKMAANQEAATQVMVALSDLEASANKNNALNADKRNAMVSLFSRVGLTLRSTQGVLNAPSDKTAKQQTNYPEVAADQGITMEQAQAVVIGNKLQEWHADLESSPCPMSAASSPDVGHSPSTAPTVSKDLRASLRPTFAVEF